MLKRRLLFWAVMAAIAALQVASLVGHHFYWHRLRRQRANGFRRITGDRAGDHGCAIAAICTASPEWTFAARQRVHLN
jgi:hypothetical protein